MSDKKYIIDTNRDLDRVLAYQCEDFVLGCIELASRGYILREGEVYPSLTGYQAYFDKPNTAKGVPEPEVEPETEEAPEEEVEPETEEDKPALDKPALDKPALDEAYIKGMLRNKATLEEYGKKYGIDLKRNKSFDNMLSDLRNHVGS